MYNRIVSVSKEIGVFIWKKYYSSFFRRYKNIELGIIEGLSKAQIARKINRHPSTIAKEIVKHRKLKPRNTFNRSSICIHLKRCGKCYQKCDNYQEPFCSRRDRNIDACNSCPNISSCKLDKYFYYATSSNKVYLYALIDSRVDINLDYSELKQIATIIKSLLDKGQTIYQILENHKEIIQCSKTLYTYIEMGLFKDFGIDNFSLKKKVSRRIKSKNSRKDVNQLITKKENIKIILNMLRLTNMSIQLKWISL